MAMTNGSAARSYYGHPILKEPVWKPEIGWYFFTGGMAGGAATLALVARAAGRTGLSRAATRVAALAGAASPPLLIKDLGRPERFLNMFRVFKLRSPMSVGSWTLAASATASGISATCDALDIFPGLADAGRTTAGILGPALSTYTAVLLSDTSVPVWFEARRELPLVFAAGAAAGAGAATALTAPADCRGPARRLAIAGAVGELAAAKLMEDRLGDLGRPYHEGRSGQYARAARMTLSAGALLALGGQRRRTAERLGAALILTGTVCERFAVLHAGKASASDPAATVLPQRARARATTSG
jgi:formate-dependent nitrite reductase membrane component NrfD